MKSLFSLLLILPTFLFAQDFSKMQEESVGAQISGNTKLKMLMHSNASMTIGNKLSRIKVKLADVKHNIVSNQKPVFYVRGISSAGNIPVCLIKFNEKGKSLSAMYNSELGKAFEFIPLKVSSADAALNIHKVSIKDDELKDGYYGLFFRNGRDDGNINEVEGKWDPRPYVFEFRQKSSSK